MVSDINGNKRIREPIDMSSQIIAILYSGFFENAKIDAP